MKLRDAPPEIKGRAYNAALAAWMASLRADGVVCEELGAYEAFVNMAITDRQGWPDHDDDDEETVH